MIHEIDPGRADENDPAIDAETLYGNEAQDGNLYPFPRPAQSSGAVRPLTENGSLMYRLFIAAFVLASSQIHLINDNERIALCVCCGERTPEGTTLRHRNNCASAEVIRIIDRFKELHYFDPSQSK